MLADRNYEHVPLRQILGADREISRHRARARARASLHRQSAAVDRRVSGIAVSAGALRHHRAGDGPGSLRTAKSRAQLIAPRTAPIRDQNYPRFKPARRRSLTLPQLATKRPPYRHFHRAWDGILSGCWISYARRRSHATAEEAADRQVRGHIRSGGEHVRNRVDRDRMPIPATGRFAAVSTGATMMIPPRGIAVAAQARCHSCHMIVANCHGSSTHAAHLRQEQNARYLNHGRTDAKHGDRKRQKQVRDVFGYGNVGPAPL